MKNLKEKTRKSEIRKVVEWHVYCARLHKQRHNGEMKRIREYTSKYMLSIDLDKMEITDWGKLEDD